MSHRARVLSIIAVATLPLAVMAAVLLWQDVRDSEDRIGEDRIALARASALAVGSYVEGNLATVQTLAVMPLVREQISLADITPHLAAVAAENPQWEGIGLIGPDGYTRASSQGPPSSLFVGDRPYFLEVTASGHATVSAALIGRASQQPTIALVAPVDLASGGRGLLVAPMRVDRIAEDLRAQVHRDTRSVVLVDREGQTFLHPDPARVRELAPVRGRPDVDAALAGQAGKLILDLDGTQALVAYAPVPRFGWAVLVVEPVATAFEPVRTSASHSLALLVLAVATVAGIGWYFGGRLSHFYDLLVEATTRANRLHGEALQAVATRDEFLASASHDLRNPVTSIKATAEVLLLEMERTGAVDMARLKSSLAGIDATATRMAALISGFLDVARLQIGRPLDLQRRPTDIAALTQEVAVEVQRTSNKHQILVEGESALVGHWDGARLRRVVSNLLGNALTYSPEGGDVRVTLARVDGSDAEAVLTVRDTGLGIPAEDLPRIFERFHRGRNVVDRIPGVGMGLAGAWQIVEQHGGTIAVDSQEGYGTTVTIRLPIDPPSHDDSELPPQPG